MECAWCGKDLISENIGHGICKSCKDDQMKMVREMVNYNKSS